MKKQHLVYSFVLLFSASLHASPNRLIALASQTLQAALSSHNDNLTKPLTILHADLATTLKQAHTTIAHVPGFDDATEGIEKKMIALESSLAEGKQEEDDASSDVPCRAGFTLRLEKDPS